MKDLDNLDKEHAALYRWFRKNLTASMFERLTNVDYFSAHSEIEIDLMLRDAFAIQQRHDVPFDLAHRSKIRSGIFPPALGIALEDFVEARIESATASEGISGRTFNDIDQEIKHCFLILCEEMAKLR